MLVIIAGSSFWSLTIFSLFEFDFKTWECETFERETVIEIAVAFFAVSHFFFSGQLPCALQSSHAHTLSLITFFAPFFYLLH